MVLLGPEPVENVESFLEDLDAWIKAQPREKRSTPRVNRRALAVFLVLGVPSAVMLLASFLAYWGIYVDLLRPLWRPEPSEDVKWLLGGVALFVTLFDLLRSH